MSRTSDCSLATLRVAKVKGRKARKAWSRERWKARSKERTVRTLERGQKAWSRKRREVRLKEGS